MLFESLTSVGNSSKLKMSIEMGFQEEESNYFVNKIMAFPPPHAALMLEQQRLEETKRQRHYTLSDRLGLNDLLSPMVWRASLSELFGTATLVFLIETIIISSYETNIVAPKLVMTIFITITVALLVLATIPVSGGHINPTVSLSAALVGAISMSRAIIYIFAQCTGSILGSLALKAVISDDIEETYSLGGCRVKSDLLTTGSGRPVVGLGTAQAFWLEIICSFLFLFASRWIALDQRQAKSVGRITVCSAIGISAGLSFFVSSTVTGRKGYSGAGINPARCFGPAVVRGGDLWNGHWVFWAGPAVASLMFYLYTKIIPEQHFRPRNINTV